MGEESNHKEAAQVSSASLPPDPALNPSFFPFPSDTSTEATAQYSTSTSTH